MSSGDFKIGKNTGAEKDALEKLREMNRNKGQPKPHQPTKEETDE